MKKPSKELWSKCLGLLMGVIVLVALIFTVEWEKQETYAERVEDSDVRNEEGNGNGPVGQNSTGAKKEPDGDEWNKDTFINELKHELLTKSGRFQENDSVNMVAVIEIPKPKRTTTLRIGEQGLDRSVTITISDIGQEKLKLLSIRRHAGNKIYLGTPVQENSSTDPVRSIHLKNNKKNEAGIYEQKMKMKLAHFYEMETVADEEHFYIMLIRPRVLYDRILVIDAGHGGLNSGTYSPGNSIYYEKDVNLDVVLRLKGYLDKLETESQGTTKVYYTRMSDKNVPLAARVGLANDVQADLFISVHCNGNYDTSMYGVETLYGGGTKHSEEAARLADIFMRHLVEKTGLAYRATYQRNDLHIIRNSRVPVCLCEIGYLSNYSDRIYLESDNGRQTVAGALYEGILESLAMMENSEDESFSAGR